MTELAEILHPSLELVSHKLQLATYLQRAIANDNASFHVKNYGAVCDGSTDDTASVLAAIAAASVSGGVVWFPPGQTRVRQTMHLKNGGTGLLAKAVSLRGAVENTSMIYWDPISITDDCVLFENKEFDYHAPSFGGVCDLQIQSIHQNARGCGIRLDNGFAIHCSNVTVRDFAGVGGVGIKLHASEFEDGAVSQHCVFDNCNVVNCETGLILDHVNSLTFYKQQVNAGTGVGVLVVNASVDWYSGAYQGAGVMFEFRPNQGNAIEFKLHGGHLETQPGAVTFKGYPPDGEGYAGFVGLYGLHLSAGTDTVFDFERYGLHIENPHGGGLPQVGLKARDCIATFINCGWTGWRNLPECYDVDALTAKHSTWIDAGNISIGTARPGNIENGDQALTLGGALSLAALTQTQRNALEDVAARDVIFNTSAQRPQFYSGTRWRSFRDATVKELLGSANYKAHFDARLGVVTSNKWADLASSRVMTGVNGPAYAADSGYFGGRSVWKFDRTLEQYMDSGSGGATVIALGAHTYYFGFVARLSVLNSDEGRMFFGMDNAAAGATFQLLRRNATPGGMNVYQVGAYTMGSDPVIDASPHFFEVYLLSSGQRAFAIDGTAYEPGDNIEPGLATLGAIERFSIMGVVGTPTFCASGSVAEFFGSPAIPTSDVRAALLELMREKWEF